MRTNTAGASAVGSALAVIREKLKITKDFPAEVIADAQAAAERLNDPEFMARFIDRREIPFVTVDPATSMDLDQAVHLEREGEGYLVRYAISAVGLLMDPSSALEAETRRRGQTIYGPDGSIPLHPDVLAHGAASLLPDEDRPAYLWYHHLSGDGELTGTWVEPALVRSVAKLSYVQVQDAVDGKTPLPQAVPGDFVDLFAEVGTKRLECEERRGGISLALPEQVIEASDSGYRLAFRDLTAVENWNAQVSLLTGMAAANIMSRVNFGVLRTMPEAERRDVERLRRVAKALGLSWEEEMSYPDFVRSISADTPEGAAFLTEATSLFRGAAYSTLPAPEDSARHGANTLEHAALAARYAHVTAPLRRLVDRYGLEVCRCVCADEEVPQWVHEGLGVVAAQMAASARIAGQYERDAVDVIEAVILAGREGESFDGVVVDVFHRRSRAQDPGASGLGTVMLRDPAVQANIVAKNLRRGQRVRAVLRRAEIATGTVEFGL